MSDVTVTMSATLTEWAAEALEFYYQQMDEADQAMCDDALTALRAAKPWIDDPQGLTDAYMLGRYDGKKDAKAAGDEWQPVEVTTNCPEWDCACGSPECNDGRTLYIQDPDVIGIWADNGMTDITITLPDNIRLCRRRPEGA